jgi:GrpB-like predicted nucleotidyltransferase (UPF0157 family)
MKIEILEYNLQWETDFLSLKEQISAILAELSPVIEHVGSTSVKGLGAKPIIDILTGVKDHSDLEMLPEKMVKHGFSYFRIYNEVMPERRLLVKLRHPENLTLPQYYDKGEPHPRLSGFYSIVNCHCVVTGSEFWNRHLAFRNYLRNNDEARDEYYRLKKALAEKDWVDTNEYADAKTEFIRSIEAMAMKKAGE